MIDFGYLSKGLNALARAHQLNTMAGHLGASVIAGYFVGEQHPDLDERVARGIEDDLDRVMQGESVFGAKRKKNAAITDPEFVRTPFPRSGATKNASTTSRKPLRSAWANPGSRVIMLFLPRWPFAR